MRTPLGFIHAREDRAGRRHLDADYGDQVAFGRLGPAGTGCEYEVFARWYALSTGPAMRLELFYSGFPIFTDCPRLFAYLSELLPGVAEKLSPVEFCEVLLEHGFVDCTDRTRSAEPETCPTCHRAYADLYHE